MFSFAGAQHYRLTIDGLLSLLVDQQTCVRPSSLSSDQGRQGRIPSPDMSPATPDLSLFLDLDPSIVHQTFNGPYRRYSPSVTFDNNEITTSSTGPTSDSMQGLTIHDFPSSNAQPVIRLSPRDGEEMQVYDVDLSFGAYSTNNMSSFTRDHIVEAGALEYEIEDNDLHLNTDLREIGHECSSLKRRSQYRIGRASKRLRVADGGRLTLEHYILTERAKHERLSIEFPERIYILPESIEAEPTNEKDEHLSIARTLFAGVGNCESLVLLQAFIIQERNKVQKEGLDPSRPLSLQQRMDAIERLGTRIAYYELLRRYHILGLYTEHTLSPLGQEHPFIVDTDERCFSRGRGKRGNPQNHAAAQVTLAMFRDMYSSVPHQAVPEKKYRLFKRLRRLGQRFHLLTNVFGYGVLALLPLASPELPGLTVTDDMYEDLNPPR